MREAMLIKQNTRLDPYQWHERSILYRDSKLTIIVDDTYEVTQAMPIQITGKIGFSPDSN